MNNEDIKKLSDLKLSLNDLLEKCKEDVASALLLWKDFKSSPPEGDWVYASIMSIKMAEALECKDEFIKLTNSLPKFKITI